MLPMCCRHAANVLLTCCRRLPAGMDAGGFWWIADGLQADCGGLQADFSGSRWTAVDGRNAGGVSFVPRRFCPVLRHGRGAADRATDALRPMECVRMRGAVTKKSSRRNSPTAFGGEDEIRTRGTGSPRTSV